MYECLYQHNVNFSNTDVTWTWLQGDKLADVHQSKTSPGGRSGMTTFWQQDNQAMWMFGGEKKEGKTPSVTNDLWKLEKSSKWTLVYNGSSSNTDEIPAARQLAAGCGIQYTYFVVYGGLGKDEKVLGDTWIYYKPENKWYILEAMQKKMGVNVDGNSSGPPARGDAAVWCQDGGNLVVFGGFGSDNKLRHDMWVFSLSAMTWTQSETSSKLPADPSFIKHLTTYPNGRSGATTWSSGDNFYMYGGNIQHKNVRSKHLNTGNAGDLWSYSMKASNWTYLSGKKGVCTRAGEFGVKGRASGSNVPGCRRRASAWVDSKGNLWMFGGDGADVSQESISVFKHSKLLSDLWYFNLEDISWTWKGGLQAGDQGGHFGEMGKADYDYLPGSRCETMVWSVGNLFFLFGGVGHDINGNGGYLSDIWQLDVKKDSSITRDPYAGAVFGIIFLGVGLVIAIVVLNCFLKGRFKDNTSTSIESRVRYSPLSLADQ